MWDAAFLWFMLDNINDTQYANMYYHHGNDEDMKAWRREADRLANDNVELKAKLAKLDAEMEKVKATGAPIDPSYVPDDAGDIALAAKIVEETEKPVTNSGWSIWPWLIALAIGGGLVFALYHQARRRTG